MPMTAGTNSDIKEKLKLSRNVFGLLHKINYYFLFGSDSGLHVNAIANCLLAACCKQVCWEAAPRHKDISSCAYVNRLSLHQMRSRLSSLQLDFALIIQGDSDAELPERLLDRLARASFCCRARSSSVADQGVWAASTLHFVDMDELIHTPRSVSPSPLQKSPETASLQKRPPVSFFE